MRVMLLVAAMALLLTGCATYQGGTATESGVTTGEAWPTSVFQDPRPPGGFHQ